ncbi:TPA: hypothetical protein DDW69_02460 [candidate division CPR2 bacterium]|uniref:Uncharacterized protein n=1 Tax=candidate division CPR2 bacterium GW2011_GWC1_41_48 TaxID=1618344 RepID=A0A0G0WA53_UNCC2|nr:MAG: hypothetical protein UT47_C0001G0294 [candidate division CPR2 bacterium GW2011_GWC2_39_35]KKR27623.1 MAG: hypothetical protein UT59_C0051G0004 [candidate division CPR2 bacterium GW2011_GWD1_39_7]KKR28846.1 MAG: hypothetical protein UT60_C0011G0012 [candidate division CPR2 bacterium GW2011_GWD2_39_7]KKS09889.1 MAG: hypothetical protein UU65_C0001G0294 [candidate division CPR2 bacterium GW2011_GWC1_41_48]OGB59445.1 MAG: hypothetical protein A2Y27_03840 [candidate division CPR2 bacterium G
MINFQGTIIEESLVSKEVLNKVKVISTETSQVTERHKTPWVSQWTMYLVEVPESDAEKIAEQIKDSLDPDHAWYADYRNEDYHYVIFRDEVFLIDRKDKQQYEEAKQHGAGLGIPDYQLDFK